MIVERSFVKERDALIVDTVNSRRVDDALFDVVLGEDKAGLRRCLLIGEFLVLHNQAKYDRFTLVFSAARTSFAIPGVIVVIQVSISSPFCIYHSSERHSHLLCMVDDLVDRAEVQNTDPHRVFSTERLEIQVVSEISLKGLLSIH